MKLKKTNTRNGWRTVKLGELCVEDRETVEPKSSEAQERSYLSLEHIFSGSGEIIKDESLAVEDEGRSLTFAFDNRHVLYGKLRPYLNKVALPDFAGRCTTELIPLLPNPDTDREFLAWMLRRQETVSFAMQGKTGSRMPRADMDELLKMEVPFVPIGEQRQMAARLREQMAEVERARAAVQAQLDAAKILPTALLRDIFASAIARRWPIASLGDVSEVIGGMQKTPDRAPHKFHKQFLTVRNVQRGYLDLSNVERFEVTPAEFERLRLQQGDLLIVEGNGSVAHIGRNALFKEEGEWIHQNHIIRVRLSKDRFMPEFVSEYLNSEAGCAQMLEKAKTTTGLYTLSTKKIAALEVPMPSLAEQRKVASRLDAELTAARSLVETLETRLAEIELLPATLLRSAFSQQN
jgi:type I restriction enzyme S subunit